MQVTRFPLRANDGTSERIADFLAHLRDSGFNGSVEHTQTTLQALQQIDLSQWQQTRLALKAICCKHSDDYQRFDDLFDAYWRNRGLVRDTTRAKPQQRSGRKTNRHTESEAEVGVSGTADDRDSEHNDAERHHSGNGKLIGSRLRNLQKTDLRELMTPEQLAQAAAVAERLAKSLRDRRSRRRRRANRGAALDMRRIVRSSVAHGGEPLQLFRKRRPERPMQLVTLLDVSGSMQVYSRVFLAFLRGLMRADEKTDAYLFHTGLVRISDALRDHDTLRAVNRLSILAQGFGGGTKIGSCLQQFNQQYVAQSVTSRSVVIILSDGYDTGPSEKIANALERLKKRRCKIIWLNPLAGWKDYEPVAAGMAAAMPWLDYFTAANTLDSLAALEPHLSRL